MQGSDRAEIIRKIIMLRAAYAGVNGSLKTLAIFVLLPLSLMELIVLSMAGSFSTWSFVSHGLVLGLFLWGSILLLIVGITSILRSGYNSTGKLVCTIFSLGLLLLVPVSYQSLPAMERNANSVALIAQLNQDLPQTVAPGVIRTYANFTGGKLTFHHRVIALDDKTLPDEVMLNGLAVGDQLDCVALGQHFEQFAIEEIQVTYQEGGLVKHLQSIPRSACLPDQPMVLAQGFNHGFHTPLGQLVSLVIDIVGVSNTDVDA